MTNTKAAVPAQRDDLRKLLDRLSEHDAAQATYLRSALNMMWLNRTLTVEEAAKYIKAILTTVNSFEKKATTIIPGKYAVDTDEGHLAFYEVWEGKGGYIGVSLRVSDSFYPTNKAAAQTILEKILKVGPLAASQKYGKEFKHCGVCGRGLTKEISRELGIGPVCILKF